jgi:hypothetical protein
LTRWDHFNSASLSVAPVSNLAQVREKFWGFFGVFTDESRKLTIKDKPSPPPTSKQ